MHGLENNWTGGQRKQKANIASLAGKRRFLWLEFGGRDLEVKVGNLKTEAIEWDITG